MAGFDSQGFALSALRTGALGDRRERGCLFAINHSLASTTLMDAQNARHLQENLRDVKITLQEKRSKPNGKRATGKLGGEKEEKKTELCLSRLSQRKAERTGGSQPGVLANVPLFTKPKKEGGGVPFFSPPMEARPRRPTPSHQATKSQGTLPPKKSPPHLRGNPNKETR